MSYYVYILQSEKDGRFYIGQTQNLKERLSEHNKGYSTYTKSFRPWKMVAYRAFSTRKESMEQEKKLKDLKSQTRLIRYIDDHIFERSGAPIPEKGSSVLEDKQNRRF